MLFFSKIMRMSLKKASAHCQKLQKAQKQLLSKKVTKRKSMPSISGMYKNQLKMPNAQKIKMSKTLISVLLLCFICIPAASSRNPNADCWGQDCEFNNQVEASITEIVPLTEKQFRRSFWYYLRKSDLIFQANIDTLDRYLMIFIFRNYVGTFMGIGTWDKQTHSAEVATFVRLGNGYSQDVETKYSPVKIDPFIISLRLNFGEYLVEVDENGDFRVNGELFQLNEEDDDAELEAFDLDEKVKCVDDAVREKYWYYLDGRDPALLIHAEPILTNQRAYVITNYINIVGHFLVIGSCNDTKQVIIHTFVRLGNGYLASEIQEVPPVELHPSVSELNW